MSLDCPRCEKLRLCDIIRRSPTRPRMTYFVRCLSCRTEFTGMRPPDVWRLAKRTYGLSATEVRKLQRYALATVVERVARGDAPLSRGEALERVMRFAAALKAR